MSEPSLGIPLRVLSGLVGGSAEDSEVSDDKESDAEKPDDAAESDASVEAGGVDWKPEMPYSPPKVT